MDLDQVRPFHFAQVGPAAPLINSQERFKSVQGAAVDVQVVWQQLADGRPPAGFVDGLGAAGPEEEIIGQTACV